MFGHNISYIFIIKFSLERGVFMDCCISCGIELAIMERNRVECWECREATTESYSEDE
jgi:uncharacterized membrane protein